MDNNETIQNFGDMVEATQKLSEPWQRSCFHMKILLGITNLLWAIALTVFILFAYLTPAEMQQGQQFNDGTQSQSYTEGVTHGG